MSSVIRLPRRQVSIQNKVIGPCKPMGAKPRSGRREQGCAAALEGSDTLRMEGPGAMPADGDFGGRRA